MTCSTMTEDAVHPLETTGGSLDQGGEGWLEANAGEEEGEEEAVKKFCADYCIEHGIEWRDGATLKNTDDEMIQNIQLLIVSAWTR